MTDKNIEPLYTIQSMLQTETSAAALRKDFLKGEDTKRIYYSNASTNVM